MKARNIIVTGGAGFIGSNLVRELAYRNHVIVVDVDEQKVNNIKE